MRILSVIPARGGSKGIPRKNIKLLCGKPLISYVIRTLKESSFDMDIVVSSDDEEILVIASRYGADPIMRPEKLATDDVTLDPVIYHAVTQMEQKNGYQYDYVLTIQPTSPLLQTETLDSAVRSMIEKDYDTLISAVNAPRLSWRMEDGVYVPNYKKRVNRQYMDKNYVETGGFVISKRKVVTEHSRFGEKLSVYEVSPKEGIDIDNIEDWWLVEKHLKRKKIMIRVDGYLKIGLGHIYRGLQLIESLTDSDVFFVLHAKSDTGIKKIESSFYPYIVINDNAELPELIKKYQVDIVINDILNTTVAYMEMLRQCNVRIINFEDLGEGAFLADAVINDLYDKQNDDPKFYWGSDYYLIRDEFLLAESREFSDTVKEIIVLFGGTDPQDLTGRTVAVLRKVAADRDIHITIILGMGYDKRHNLEMILHGCEDKFSIVQDVRRMTDYMRKADLAISAMGRTMLELAAMSVPTILLAEHARESRHEFGGLENGFLNMGIGIELEEKTLYETIVWLIECTQVRRAMHAEMRKKDLRHGFSRVEKIIMGCEKDE